MFFHMGRCVYRVCTLYQVLRKILYGSTCRVSPENMFVYQYTKTLFRNPGILLVGHDIVQRAPLLREKFSRMVQEEAKSSLRPLAARGRWLEWWEPKKTEQADTPPKKYWLIIPEDWFQVLALFKANSKGQMPSGAFMKNLAKPTHSIYPPITDSTWYHGPLGQKKIQNGLRKTWRCFSLNEVSKLFTTLRKKTIQNPLATLAFLTFRFVFTHPPVHRRVVPCITCHILGGIVHRCTCHVRSLGFHFI